jgi:hypothetical protein
MHIVYDADEDGKWITIHPNGSAKGRHVKVNGEGEIVAGNKHLVAVLKEDGGVSKEYGKGGGGGEKTDDIGPILSAGLGGEEFAPFDADDFGDLLEEFKSPEDDDFTGLLDDDIPEESEEENKGTTVGKVTVCGKEIHIGVGPYTQEELNALKQYYQNFLPLFEAKSLAEDTLKGSVSYEAICKVVGEQDVVARAYKARLDYISTLKAKCVIIDQEAEKIDYSEAKGIVEDEFEGACFDVYQGPDPFMWKRSLKKTANNVMMKKVKFLACAVKDFKSRFPNAPLGELMKKTVVLLQEINMEQVCGLAADGNNGIAIAMDCTKNWATTQWHESHHFPISPKHRDVPFASYTGYYISGSEFSGVLIHEVAHQFFKTNSWSFREAAKKCYKEYAFGSNDVTHYANTSTDEYHSEVVATIASPLYIQGSFPEPLEKYVYEEVLGCKPGSWKKRESMWKKKQA